MPKPKKLPENFSVMEAWEELHVLLEVVETDLKKTIVKGTKRAGVSSRKGLKEAKELINNIIHGSIQEQKRARELKPPHGNRNGKGILAMKEARERKEKNQ